MLTINRHSWCHLTYDIASHASQCTKSRHLLILTVYRHLWWWGELTNSCHSLGSISSLNLHIPVCLDPTAKRIHYELRPGSYPNYQWIKLNDINKIHVQFSLLFCFAKYVIFKGWYLCYKMDILPHPPDAKRVATGINRLPLGMWP